MGLVLYGITPYGSTATLETEDRRAALRWAIRSRRVGWMLLLVAELDPTPHRASGGEADRQGTAAPAPVG